MAADIILGFVSLVTNARYEARRLWKPHMRLLRRRSDPSLPIGSSL